MSGFAGTDVRKLKLRLLPVQFLAGAGGRCRVVLAQMFLFTSGAKVARR